MREELGEETRYSRKRRPELRVGWYLLRACTWLPCVEDVAQRPYIIVKYFDLTEVEEGKRKIIAIIYLIIYCILSPSALHRF